MLVLIYLFGLEFLNLLNPKVQLPQETNVAALFLVAQEDMINTQDTDMFESLAEWPVNKENFNAAKKITWSTKLPSDMFWQSMNFALE